MIIAPHPVPCGAGRAAALLSILARQQDGVVGEPQGDAGGREVGEGDVFAVDGPAIAVAAGQRGAAPVNVERPDLKRLGFDCRLAPLRQRDFVEQPVSARLIGNVFCAVGIDDSAIEAVAVPVLAACKQVQIGSVRFSSGLSLLGQGLHRCDAALALAESGVCKPQGESEGGGGGRRRSRASAPSDCPWPARRRGGAPKPSRAGHALSPVMTDLGESDVKRRSRRSAI